MPSRDINDCVPELVAKYTQFKEKMEQAGLFFGLTCTARSDVEQLALYMQGRYPLEAVNLQRARAKLWPISYKENARCVTWTLNSKHIVDGVRFTQARAFDIALLGNGKFHWDLKANLNKNEIPDYKEAALIAQSVGLIPGYFFRKCDACHYEI